MCTAPGGRGAPGRGGSLDRPLFDARLTRPFPLFRTWQCPRNGSSRRSQGKGQGVIVLQHSFSLDAYDILYAVHTCGPTWLYHYSFKKSKKKDRTDGDGNELAQGCPRYSFCTTLLGRVDCNRTALPRGRVLRKRCGSFHLRLVRGTSPSSV